MSASAPERVLPSDDDPFLKSGVAGLGGRPGAHARLGERRFWTPVRWLVLLTLVTSLLGFAQKAPCRTHPWVDSYQYTRACYTDVFALYFAERLSDGQTPYTQFPVEYPVVIGGVMKVVSEAVEVFPADQRPRRFYDLTWLLLTACAVVVTVATSKLAGRRRVWDAAMFAVAPGLLLHGSTNWDLVAGAFAMLGLVAWARRRPVVAGVLLGVATATKLYPVLFLIPLLALCWRARKMRAWLQAAVALAVTGAVIVLPVYLISPSFAEINGQQVRVADSPLDRFGTDGLSALSPHVTAPDPTQPGLTVEGTNSVYRFVQLNRTRGADWDSLYFAVGRLRVAEPDSTLDRARNGAIALVLDEQQAPGEPPSVLNRAVAVSFILSLIAIGVLTLKAPRRPRVAALLFLTLVAFSLTNKVFSPQFVIWLLPLAVLARPRWRPFLAWQATEALVLLTRFYFFISNDKPGQGIDVKFFIFAILLRDVALVLYSALVVRDVLHPDRDVVRRDGVDDPMGGVLDGAPDGTGGVSLVKPREKQPA